MNKSPIMNINLSRTDDTPDLSPQPAALLLPAYEYHAQRLFYENATLLSVFLPPKVSTSLEIPNHHLPQKLLGDIVIGCSVTAVVSPCIAIFDKAIVQKSAGNSTLLSSMLSSVTTMLRDPVAYAKSPTFLWMWATYAATYCAANTIKTMTEHRQYVALSKATATTTKSAAAASSSSASRAVFLGTTFANTSACLVKDRAYAKLFGNAASSVVPKITYAVWILRDFAVIGSSFILPDRVAPLLEHEFPTYLNDQSSKSLAQLITPMAAQLVASPLHFYGLDCYNRPLTNLRSLSSRALERSRFLVSNFRSVTIVRMVRVLPGFGIAGVWNAKLRNKWREHLMEQEVVQLLQHA